MKAYSPGIRPFTVMGLALYSVNMEAESAHTCDADDLADIAEALDGDGDAYERLVRRHQDAIARQMWRFTRDSGQHAELVHDVFVQAYMSLSGYRRTAPFLHWLRTIAVRVGYRFWQRRKRDRRMVKGEGFETALQFMGASDGDMDARDAADLVHWALAQLPPRDRLVLTLQHLEERSVREIAELTGWSAAMVKVQAWRARAKFRKVMEQTLDKEADHGSS